MHWKRILGIPEDLEFSYFSPALIERHKKVYITTNILLLTGEMMTCPGFKTRYWASTRFILTYSFIFQLSNGARILGVVPLPSYSHQVVFQSLWKELSLRGHQLTVLTTDPINDPSLINLTEIDLQFSYKLWNDNVWDVITHYQNNILKSLEISFFTLNAIIDQQLQHPQVEALIKNETEHFDLLIVELVMPTMIAFSERFKCPVIGMTSHDAPTNVYESVGNRAHPLLRQSNWFRYEEKLALFDRVRSVFVAAFRIIYFGWRVYPLEQKTVKKHFGEDYLLLKDMEKKVSMLFTNTHLVFHPIKPLVPAVVQIGGGIHMQPSKPLPKDLQTLLDGASQGFIYFSLGTNVKSKNLPKKTIDVILETFAELPYMVLWKFELEHVHGKPDNVQIAKWFPQQDVFKHPNIKLFITQGGIQSMEEAIYAHIPIVGMPFFVDQPANIVRMVSKGFGLSVDYTKLDKESFKKAILEVINNQKYRNKIKELAEMARDKPIAGLERAVWWTEYVLRHKGAKHLRSPSIGIPLYQYLLLDVIGFCIVLTVVLLYLLLTILRLVLKLVKYFIVKPKVKGQ